MRTYWLMHSLCKTRRPGGPELWFDIKLIHQARDSGFFFTAMAKQKVTKLKPGSAKRKQRKAVKWELCTNPACEKMLAGLACKTRQRNSFGQPDCHAVHPGSGPLCQMRHEVAKDILRLELLAHETLEPWLGKDFAIKYKGGRSSKEIADCRQRLQDQGTASEARPSTLAFPATSDNHDKGVCSDAADSDYVEAELCMSDASSDTHGTLEGADDEAEYDNIPSKIAAQALQCAAATEYNGDAGAAAKAFGVKRHQLDLFRHLDCLHLPDSDKQSMSAPHAVAVTPEALRMAAAALAFAEQPLGTRDLLGSLQPQEMALLYASARNRWIERQRLLLGEWAAN